MQLTKFRSAIIIATLLAAGGSYGIGRSGVDVARAVTVSRCSAGAFIAHTQSPSTVQADVHSDEAVTLPDVSGQVAAAYAPVTLTTGNLIFNGGLETMAGAKPKGWDSNAVGDNTSSFSTVAGYNSRTGLRTDVTRYVNGTADWFGQTVTVTPGAYYQFQDYYHSNVTSRAVLMLKDNAGKSQYVNLDSLPATSAWTLETQRFFVPSNVSTIMVSHPLDQVGWLETDAYNLQQAAAPGFSDAMVSLTFDDGWRSIYTNGLPLLRRYGVVSTQYIVSGFLGQQNGYMTPGDVYEFQDSGSEIASHTVDHPDLTKLNPKDLIRQINLSHDGLSKCYAPVSDFAPPFGANNQRTIAAEKSVYETSRSTEVGFNSPDTLNPYQLKVQNVRADTSPEQVRAWLTTAKANHVWLILVYHQIMNNAGDYSRSPAAFETDLQSITASEIPIKTVHAAYAEIHKN